MIVAMGISTRRGGDPDGAQLLLVHGLGATGRVWDGLTEVLDADWDWVVPDLPGHGESTPLPHYSFGVFAAGLAAVVDRSRPVMVLGHSLGGVVGLALASGWFGVSVSVVCGLGIKVRWTEQERAKAGELAHRPARRFDTREEAVLRALKIAGLGDLVGSDSPAAASYVRRSADGWRLAMDPATFEVGTPDMPGLLAAARGRVVLAAGEHDPMCPLEHLAELHPEPVVLPGLGHNAHVEDPAAVVALLKRLRR